MPNTVYHKDLTGADLHIGAASTISIPVYDTDPDTALWGADERGMVWFAKDSNKYKGWDGTEIILIG